MLSLNKQMFCDQRISVLTENFIWEALFLLFFNEENKNLDAIKCTIKTKLRKIKSCSPIQRTPKPNYHFGTLFTLGSLQLWYATFYLFTLINFSYYNWEIALRT